MIHQEPSPLAGQTIEIISGHFKGEQFTVEDWWDRISGRSWMFSEGNPACLDYAIRSSLDFLPTDNEVLYGKIGSLGLGKLVHVKELAKQPS